MSLSEGLKSKMEASELRPADSGRRSFMGRVGIGAAAAALAAVPLEPLFEGNQGQAEASVVQYPPASRSNASFIYRTQTAQNDHIDIGELPDNGDAQRFTDFSGSWSKCLPHPNLGIVSPSAWLSLTHALSTGRFQDFENIQVGNPGGPGFTGTLNGPKAPWLLTWKDWIPMRPASRPRLPSPVRRLRLN
jgi:hypothetical protein